MHARCCREAAGLKHISPRIPARQCMDGGCKLMQTHRLDLAQIKNAHSATPCTLQPGESCTHIQVDEVAIWKGNDVVRESRELQATNCSAHTPSWHRCSGNLNVVACGPRAAAAAALTAHCRAAMAQHWPCPSCHIETATQKICVRCHTENPSCQRTPCCPNLTFSTSSATF